MDSHLGPGVDRMDVPNRRDDDGGDLAKLNADMEAILERHRERTRQILAEATSDVGTFYRVVAERIGHKVIKGITKNGGPIVIDYDGGLKASRDPNAPVIIQEEDIGFLFGAEAIGQIPRFIRIGAIVPCMPYVDQSTGMVRYLDLPSPDHIPFSRNE